MSDDGLEWIPNDEKNDQQLVNTNQQIKSMQARNPESHLTKEEKKEMNESEITYY